MKVASAPPKSVYAPAIAQAAPRPLFRTSVSSLIAWVLSCTTELQKVSGIQLFLRSLIVAITLALPTSSQSGISLGVRYLPDSSSAELLNGNCSYLTLVEADDEILARRIEFLQGCPLTPPAICYALDDGLATTPGFDCEDEYEFQVYFGIGRVIDESIL